jgi:SOS-response transcriptional repressor LexA
MTTKQERLIEVYNYLRDNLGVHTKTDFAEGIRITRPALSAAMNGNKAYLTNNLFTKICAKYPNIFNLDYLLTGKGELLLENELNNHPIYEIVSEQKGQPYYNVDFAAGFNLLENDQTVNPDYFINCRPYNDCDCWCNAHGNSMYPTIASGDIIAMKRIYDFSYLINGEIYAIVTSNGLRTIKRVRDNGDTITLIPDNKEVDEQTIPKSIITHVFLIKGSLKQF